MKSESFFSDPIPSSFFFSFVFLFSGGYFYFVTGTLIR